MTSTEQTGPNLTPLTVIHALLDDWRIVVALPLLGVICAGAFAIVNPGYVSLSRFVPAGQSGGSSLNGLAASLGVEVPAGGRSTSPDLYVDLVRSGEVLRPVAQAEYRFPVRRFATDSISGTLPDLLNIQSVDGSEAGRVLATLEELRERISPSVNLRSSVVSLQVAMPWEMLAEQVNQRLLESLGAFDSERRVREARAERVFLEERLAQAEMDLRDGERALAGFLDRNKRPDQSIHLRIELERHQRAIATAQQVYVTVRQLYERARLEEARNTPVIVTVDSPAGSARDAVSVVWMGMLGGVLGFSGAVVVVVARLYVKVRADSPGMAELLSRLHRFRFLFQR